MKRAIEFEEKISFKHRVVIDCENETLFEEVCNLTRDSFDDVIRLISKIDGLTVLEISEEFSEDTEEDVGYYDDYWTKDEIELYGESNE